MAVNRYIAKCKKAETCERNPGHNGACTGEQEIVVPEPILDEHTNLVVRAAEAIVNRQMAAFQQVTNPPDIRLLTLLGDSDLETIIHKHPGLHY